MPRRAPLYMLVVVAVMSAACSGWHNTGGPAEGVARAKSGEIRVYRNDGSNVLLVNASIVGDSLIGFAPAGGARVAMPMSAIVSTETKGVSASRTAMLGGGIVLGIAIVGIIALGAAMATAY